MAGFILIATLLMGAAGLIWNAQDVLNFIIKFVMLVMTAWGGYLLLGAPNLISQLAK